MVRNEQILRDVLLKMNYDSSKTLNENIKEQSRFELDFNRTYSDPKRAAQANREMSDFVSEYRHELIDIAAIGALIIPGVGPLISLGLELANSGLYYSEGDKYMAGFSLAFALIPGAELFAKIPSVKKLGRDGLASLIKKARSGGKLTKIEADTVEQISKNEKWLKLKSIKEATKLMVKGKLQKATLKDIVFAVYKFAKKNPTKFNLTKMGLSIGGIYYTYDKLAKMYGIGDEMSINKSSSTLSLEELEQGYENNKEEVTNEVAEQMMLVTDTVGDYEMAEKYFSKYK